MSTPYLTGEESKCLFCNCDVREKNVKKGKGKAKKTTQTLTYNGIVAINEVISR